MAEVSSLEALCYKLTAQSSNLLWESEQVI